MRPDTLGVIGLGAMGGSLAWQAAGAGIARVIGYSPVPAEGAAALRAGAITELANDPRKVARRADLLVLAAPPGATLRLLADLADEIRGRGMLCTDVTSVKRPIVSRAQALGLAAHFAGSHPLTGTEQSGFAAARSTLYRDALVYVTPVSGGDRAAQEVADFWAGVCGSAPVMLDAGDHDRMLAWTSHLAQIVASGLAAALARSGPKAVSYGPGTRDTTRLAGSSPEMWRDILLLNREPVLAALDGLEDQFGELRRALAGGDARALTAWLKAGREWRRRVET